MSDRPLQSRAREPIFWLRDGAGREREVQHEVEQRFRAAFEHIPVGQLLSDMTGSVCSANRTLATMLGYEPEEMLGRPVRDFVAPSDYTLVLDDVAELGSGRSATTSSARRLRHRCGESVPALVCSALATGDGDEPRWLSIIVDLTEHERTRESLERSRREAVGAADRMRLLHGIARTANDMSCASLDIVGEVLEATCDHLGSTAAAALLEWPDRDGAPEVHHVRTRAVGEVRSRAALVASLSHLRPEHLAQGANRVLMHGYADRHCTVVPIELPDAGSFALVVRTEDEPSADRLDLLSMVGIEVGMVVQRVVTRRMLRASEHRFRSVFACSPLPMAVTFSESGTFDEVNEALCTLLGRPASEIVGLSARDVVHPDDIALTDPAGAAAAESPDGRFSFELRLVHASGSVVSTITTLQWLHGEDGSSMLLAQMEDITARRRAEAGLRRQATRDSLTGLANRSQLGTHLRTLAGREAHCAVLFIDLDGFKLVNDSRGHEVGDEVLAEVAARLRRAVRPDDLVARFGGDEFVVVSEHRGSGGAADLETTGRLIADRIEESLEAPVITSCGAVAVSASIGVACAALPRERPDELVARADKAMYRAKELGRSRTEMYGLALHRSTLERQRAEQSLRHALDEGRFLVHYQPVVDLDAGDVVGFEALVRLRDESGALVSPQSFIEVAEQSGLIVPLGGWVLEQACRTIADLRQRHGRPLSIAVNVAARQVARPDLLDTVLAALGLAELPEDALALEITESALLTAEAGTLGQLTTLRERGVSIALDDFGTGFSSMTYLRSLPVTQLKIDRSFVAGIGADAGDRAIVRAVGGLAGDLGLSCVAEGVETTEQLGLVRELGAGLAQGYLLSRPVPAEALDGVLTTAADSITALAARRASRATRRPAVGRLHEKQPRAATR